MSLISAANLQLLTDKLAYVYKRWTDTKGIPGTTYVAGTDKFIINNALNVTVVTCADYQQQLDLSTAFYTSMTRVDRKSAAVAELKAAISAINDHISQRGSSVSSAIVDIPSFLTYYNGGGGGAAFSAMLHPVFGDLYYDMFAVRLPAAGLQQPCLNPVFDATAVNGLGIRAVGGAFTAGVACEATPLYSPVVPILEVTTTFTTGIAPPTFTVAGTDDQGGTGTTWTATGGSNNPAAAISTTITPAVLATDRQVVAVASAAGIIVGSILTVNAGLVDTEVVTVEAVSGTNLTIVFDKAHNAGAALTGFTTLLLTPSTSGRRIKSVSGITIGITSHVAGAVRISGVLDRQYNPD